MSDHPDFYAFYNRVLRPEVARIEPLRHHTAVMCCVITVITVLGTFAWAAMVAHFAGWNSRITFYSCIIPIGIGACVWAPFWTAFRDAYQLKLITTLVRLYDASLGYDRDSRVGEIAFTGSGLFPRYLRSDQRHYKGNDWIKGKIGATPFEFSDLQVTLSSGRSTVHIFDGVFFVADFNKNFSGRTFVTSRHALLHLGAVPETPPGDVVTLEDPEFERTFVTHSDSQIEARYILSPALMRRILVFSQHVRKPLAIAFSGTSMFIAIVGGSTRLEPKLFRALKPSLFFGIWSNLEFLCGIVNDMDLNTRIWTKSGG